MARLISRSMVLLLPLALTGCGGWQSALDPQGPDASRLTWLIWFVTGVCAVVWTLVVLVLAMAIRRRNGPRPDPLAVNAGTDQRMTLAVAASVAATVVIIAVLTLVSFLATRGATADNDALTIRVKGTQWWWEVAYDDPRPGQSFTTANEIHIPVGRPVRIVLDSADVIHSFWVPSLAGKLDLIPGRQNVLTFTASRPGLYRGQCAEFCGLQHAHMAVLVFAENEASFEAWRRAQIAPAAEPTNAETQTGRQVFLDKACSTCHTVRGTRAQGTLGPDLTHVASRATIAAGLLPTTRGSLGAWIADPQTLKPGNNMPMVSLTPDELTAVSAYMASLK